MFIYILRIYCLILFIKLKIYIILKYGGIISLREGKKIKDEMRRKIIGVVIYLWMVY